MAATPSNQSVRQTAQWQFGLLTLFGILSLVALWCAAVVGPWLFEAALIVTGLLLARRWWRQRRRMLLIVMAALPAATGALCAPGILSDPGLVTRDVKWELLWSSVMVGVIIALLSCVLVVALMRRRFWVLSVLAMVFCPAWAAMHYYSLAYSHRNDIDFSWPGGSGPSLRVQSLRGQGRVSFRWRYSRPKQSLNYFRTGEPYVFGQGGRVRALGGFLAYLRSARDEGDHFFGPFLIVQFPYWMLAAAGALLIVPWGRFARRTRLTTSTDGRLTS